MKIEKFNSYIFESIKSSIVKRLHKEPYNDHKYVDGKYVDIAKFKQTKGFGRLKNYYSIENLDDTYFEKITKEQASKKPYNNDYLVFCFKNGKAIDYFKGADDVETEHRRRHSKGDDSYSRKGIIEDGDEFLAFDIKRADKEMSRNDIGRPRRDAMYDTVPDYNHSNNYDGKTAKQRFDDNVKKSNINRYYQAKSKNLDFSDVYNMLQLKLKKAYKELAHTIEDGKQHPDKYESSLDFPKADKTLALLISKHGYEKATGNNVADTMMVLKYFHGLTRELFNLKEKGQNASDYGHDGTSKNKELVDKLKFIHETLKKDLEENTKEKGE